MFSLKQIVPRKEHMFYSDNHAAEFLTQVHNKKNKVDQVIYHSTEKIYVCCVHLCYSKKLPILSTCCVLLENLQ